MTDRHAQEQAEQTTNAHHWHRLVCDNDCHNYVIPAARHNEWAAWLEIDADDERAWEPPAFAVRVEHIEFAAWRER